MNKPIRRKIALLWWAGLLLQTAWTFLVTSAIYS
jgi:hypothetical protein